MQSQGLLEVMFFPSIGFCYLKAVRGGDGTDIYIPDTLMIGPLDTLLPCSVSLKCRWWLRLVMSLFVVSM